jgi:hypothetical protein
LFKLVIGGYGLFGVIGTIKLRLMPRARLKRAVKVIDIDELIPAFEERIEQGYMYGDFQYTTDSTSPDFLRKGVFSCYLPVDSNEKEFDKPTSGITNRRLEKIISTRVHG